MGFFRFWFRALQEGFRDPAARPLFLSVVGLLATGTVFYTVVERWPLFDSLYFSVMTVTTVGYGDFAPHTVLGKGFTIVYVLAGIALILAFAEAVLQRAMRLRSGQSAPVATALSRPRGELHD